MKKIVILTVVTVVMVFSTVMIPRLFEKTLAKAEITAMSNIIYTEYVNATGEVDCNEEMFIVNAAVREDDISKVKIGQQVVISGKGLEIEYTTERSMLYRIRQEDCNRGNWKYSS